jgi:hypothetical protein
MVALVGRADGCTFVFDWKWDVVVVEPVRGFSAAVCAAWDAVFCCLAQFRFVTAKR